MLHITKIKPTYTTVITTGNKFEKDMVEGGIIVARKGDLKLWQTVVAVGSMVKEISVGDKVMINADHYMIKKYSKDSLQNDIDNNPSLGYKFNWVNIDNEEGETEECLILNDRDILYAFEGEEKDESVIVPGKPGLIIN